MAVIRAVNVLQPDIGHLGGISRTLRVAKFAEKYSLAYKLHSANFSS